MESKEKPIAKVKKKKLKVVESCPKENEATCNLSSTQEQCK